MKRTSERTSPRAVPEHASPRAVAERPSRREFLRLVAAGGAALMTGAAVPLARAAISPSTRKRLASAARATPTLTPAMRREIANQKAYVARALKTLREYSLPSGSAPGFTFHPLRPSRRRGPR